MAAGEAAAGAGGKGLELIDKCYEILFWGVLAALAVCVVVALVYIFRSKLTVDRIIGINLIGTTVVITIALLTFVLGEPFLADVAMIYVVISFIGPYKRVQGQESSFDGRYRGFGVY